MSAQQIITTRNITKSFGKTNVLKGVDLTIESARYLRLWDRAGAANRHFCTAWRRAISPDSGEVVLDDKRIDKLNDQQRRWCRNQI